MKHIRYIRIIFITTSLFSCASTQSTSIVYSDHYDNDNDLTSVTILPYGGLKVPGHWTKTRESNVSGQYFFIGKDSVRIAIALQPWDKFEFSNKNPDVRPDNFLKKFYEWDSNYLKERTQGQVRVVKENEEEHYLIWNLTSGGALSEYFLFGLKGKIAYNLYVSTDKWDEPKKVKFLEELYTQ